VLFSGSPDRLPSLGAALLGLPISQGESGMEVGQANRQGVWVPMHHRLVVGAVADPQYTDLVVFHLYFIVLGIDCNRVRVSLALSLGLSSHKHSPLGDRKDTPDVRPRTILEPPGAARAARFFAHCRTTVLTTRDPHGP